MVALRIRAAHPGDAPEIAANLRSLDLAEVEAATGLDPLQAILDGIEDSTECWVAEFDGELGGIWGVTAQPAGDDIISGVGSVWMLTTTVVDRHRVAFWRAWRVELGRLLETWTVLVNAIDVRHEKALRCAHRLGFVFPAPARPAGVRGEHFVGFFVTRQDFLQCYP